MWFKKRKSRKQLLQEIEDLKAEVDKYREWWFVKCDAYHSINKNIKTITASCIHNSRGNDDIHSQTVIEDCLCQQLAKELLPYVSFEKYVYAPVDPTFYGEAKYTGTIKVVEK